MKLVEQDPIWPLLVRIEGRSHRAALMNTKAYRKSIESNSPWIVHPETKRVLPWPGEPRILMLSRSYGFYELSLPGDADIYPYGEDKKPGSISFNGAGSASPHLGSDAAFPERNREGAVIAHNARQNSSLNWLTELIAERRRIMPEGSYTTHLFSGGSEKIRKKVGEEAIEVLLARPPARLVSEISDLVYHLCVLLEISDLGWQQVEEELKRRHK